MRVEIWSDVACPFCWVGKRNFELALGGFANADSVEVAWRPFQLAPAMPNGIDGDIHDVLAAKYGVTRDQAAAMGERVVAMAEQVGLAIDYAAIRPTNTRDAHRLVQLAAVDGKAGEAKERLFEAYFRDGLTVSDHGVLSSVAEDLGLDSGQVEAMLAGDRFSAEVQAGQEDALELGISAVPTFVFDRASAVPGAQDRELFSRALEAAWEAGGHAPADADNGSGSAHPSDGTAGERPGV